MGQSPGGPFSPWQFISPRRPRQQQDSGPLGPSHTVPTCARARQTPHRESRALLSPGLCAPQPAAAGKLPFLPRHPVCGRGLVCAGCEYAPAAFSAGERWGRALLTRASADPSGLCLRQLRRPRLLCKRPCYPGNPNLVETPGSPWPAA